VKRKNAALETAPSAEDVKRKKVEETTEQAVQINVLGAGMVRKKPKKVSPTQVSTT
jgi:hypothetical protein